MASKLKSLFLHSCSILTASLLLFGCEERQTPSMGGFLGKDQPSRESNAEMPADTGYTPVVKGVDIHFPDDHQAHNDFRHEWWYFTANLIDQNGNPLGIQWTQFRFAAAPEHDAPLGNARDNNQSNKKQNNGKQSNNKQGSKTSAWQSQQIYMAHSAVTNQALHYADEKWSRNHPQLAGVESNPLRVFVDDWQWQSQTNDLFPAQLQVNTPQFSYALTLTSSAPYQKQGEQGYSQKSAGGEVASYYYSQPSIEVTGEVIIDGKNHQVTGQGWIDREWSSQFLLDSQQGWDWFALRLDENTSLVLFQLRDTKTGQANYTHGRMMYRDGRSQMISQHEITLRPTKQTEIQGRDYPTQWQIHIPSQQVALTISALNPQAKMPLSVPYWEGPVIIEGSHIGKGYMELTGY